MDGPGVRELGRMEEYERKKEAGNPENGEEGLTLTEKKREVCLNGRMTQRLC